MRNTTMILWKQESTLFLQLNFFVASYEMTEWITDFAVEFTRDKSINNISICSQNN